MHHMHSALVTKNIMGNCRWSGVTVFSFHPVKIFTTAEGGAITTNNKNFLKKCLL